MEAEFPLLLPHGTVAVSLEWDEDHAWIVEATIKHDAADSTWTFGKVDTQQQQQQHAHCGPG